MLKVLKNPLWIVYFVFVIVMIAIHNNENRFISQSPYPFGKYVVWFAYLAFLSYSLYCSKKENFFKTLKLMYPMLWARQIGIDLYMGLALSISLIYWNEGSFLIVAIWLLPILVYANLVVLLYVALNYDSILAHFI